MLTYRIDAAAGIVEIIGGSETDDADVLEKTVVEVLRDPAYRSGFGFLRDRRGTTAASVEYVRRGMARLVQTPQLRGSRWAVLVSDAANYGMSRMAAVLAHTLEVQVFEDPDAARRWLAEGRPRQQR